ncbi:receptor-transporting protein 3-like [Gouania willdenowi]|uniref:Receptor-transporting protein 3-like n=1 Tax=Gouania willdenowi TaxID=441366 RepID=A0A8C5E8K5_GOUWI|nr:receptor-transporting protein 3-like [Gouania willdenowi]
MAMAYQLDLDRWTRIFQDEAQDIRARDIWNLEFDLNIDPHNPSQGWKKYIRNTSASFHCTGCKRWWPSNQVKVLFHMRLAKSGIVKVRPFCQNCKRCTNAPMLLPEISDENITNLMRNLVKKIKIKCYNEPQTDENPGGKTFAVKSPHEPTHCEGCIRGICSEKE